MNYPHPYYVIILPHVELFVLHFAFINFLYDSLVYLIEILDL